MIKVVPVHIQAAAELELRRRHAQRAAECYRCSLKASRKEFFDGVATRPDVCEHTRDQQDYSSPRNQQYRARLQAVYG